MNKMIFILLGLLFSLSAFAEDAHHAAADAHHGPVQIPWGSLFVQAFNFSVLFVILFVVLRKAVKSHFEHRAKDFRALVERAEIAKRQAEAGHREIKERLAKLESNAESGLVTARAEAEELKKRMIGEARTLSDKLQQEAKRATAAELDKAKAELRRELLQAALKTSGENLKGGLDSAEQKKLQKEFVDKIQVVN